jgi:hypothetical protein
MAHNPFCVYRISNNLKDKESKHVEQMLDAVARAREVLKSPPPDTFAGRKSQEPFPQEEEK